MRSLIIASRNRHKIEEIQSILEGIPFEISSIADFPGIPEIEEIGTTYEENALLKARQIAEATGRLALGDDTGLEVDALAGKPGLYSARFAGPGATFQNNIDKLLDFMRDVPEPQRRATFICVMALAAPSGKIQVVEGKVVGNITFQEQGEKGFGYDPVFLVSEYHKTFAEMSNEEKNKVSHRANALRKIRGILMRGGEDLQ